MQHEIEPKIELKIDPISEQIQQMDDWNTMSVLNFSSNKEDGMKQNTDSKHPEKHKNECSITLSSSPKPSSVIFGSSSMSPFENLWEDWNNELDQSKKPISKSQDNLDSKKSKIMEQIDDHDFWCEHCNKESRHPVDGYMVCIECGDYGVMCIDSGAEWRFYGQEDSKSRDPCRCGVSSNFLIPDSSIGTIISTKYGESYKMRHARRYHSWNSLNYKGRNLYSIFEKLQRNASKHGINAMISEHAKQLYKTITDTRLFRGDNKQGLIAFCVYRACKDKNVPRSIKEIATIFNIDEQVMTKGNRCFSNVWNDITESKKKRNPVQNLSKPIHYIERFCSRLRLPEQIVKRIKCIAENVHNQRLVADNTASSIAAAIIYLVAIMCNLSLSKEEISIASKISEVTIGKCFKKLQIYQEHFKVLIEELQ
jgi:transcription initiation factor TFIIB